MPFGSLLRAEGQLGAEDGREIDGAGGFREADHAVEAVVIGDRQRGEPEPGGFLGQLLGMARPVEEREVRMAVQLGVSRLARTDTHDSMPLSPPEGDHIRTYVRYARRTLISRPASSRAET